MSGIILVTNLLFDANTPNMGINSLKAENDFQISRKNFIMFYI